MTKCYRVWDKCDFGSDEYIFTSKAKAYSWVQRMLDQDDAHMTTKEAIDAELITLLELTLNP